MKQRLTKVELMLIQKGIGSAILSLPENSLRADIDKIIFRIGAATGCELPVTEFFADAIYKAFVDLLKLGYEKLTVDEVIFAIDLNQKINLKMPTGIEFDEVVFMGKTVNTNYLSKVLKNYIAVRDMVDAKIKNFQDGY